MEYTKDDTTAIINPFTPTFGSIPALLIGRQKLINDVLNGLRNGPGNPNRATIFVGTRGSGKTVLLTEITNEASKMGWVSANATAGSGMLEEIIEDGIASGSAFLDKESESRITGINVAGFGISRSIPDTPQLTWRTRMRQLVESLNNNGVGLLITVDEVDVNIPEMKTIVTTFQHFVRERRDVALLMAGLPHKISELLKDDAVSFVRRAFQRRLDPIPQSEVSPAIEKMISSSGKNIETVALRKATESTGGFPFLIQLVGYYTWESAVNDNTIEVPHVDTGIELAFDDFGHMIFDTTVKTLSEVDLLFMKAMAEDESPSTLSGIAKRMGVSSGYASRYRQRLTEQGLIVPVGRGVIDFAIPMTREYIQRRMVQSS